MAGAAGAVVLALVCGPEGEGVEEVGVVLGAGQVLVRVGAPRGRMARPPGVFRRLATREVENGAMAGAEGGAAGGADDDVRCGAVVSVVVVIVVVLKGVVDLAGGADGAADEVGDVIDGVVEGVGDVSAR